MYGSPHPPSMVRPPDSRKIDRSTLVTKLPTTHPSALRRLSHAAIAGKRRSSCRSRSLFFAIAKSHNFHQHHIEQSKNFHREAFLGQNQPADCTTHNAVLIWVRSF